MQTIGQDGHGNVAVQISGDGNTVTVSCGQVVLRLSSKHTRKREPKTELDVLRAEVRALDLVGREAELAGLDAWLDDPRPVLARGIKGRAGSGKTRLAIELCERVAARGWAAGFLDSGDLAAFVEAERVARWQPGAPLLVVVDYAARRARSLNAWLLSLAQRAEGERPRLRLLVLERHGSAEEGWWFELLRLDGSDDALLDLVDPPEPLPLEPITGTALRRALLAGGMAEGCRLAGRPTLAPPALGADPFFERRLNDAPAAEPLYLTMAGLFAARHGLDSALALGRLDLALELACWERDRLVRFARERGVNEKMLLHLVACVTLQRGLGQQQCYGFIDAETAALPYQDRMARDQLADALADALPMADTSNNLQGIEPDLIGETFCLLTLSANANLDQTALIDRCRKRAPRDTAQLLVQTVQDFARPAAELPAGNGRVQRRPEAKLLSGWLGEANPSLAWLDRLVAGTDDLEWLISIADQMPKQTVILRERSTFILERIVDVLRPIAISSAAEALPSLLAAWRNNVSVGLGDLGRREPALAAAEEAVAIGRVLAASLNSLSVRLSDFGRREPALAAAEEAVAIGRELAAAWPDAFRLDLATSLSNLANVLSDLGRQEQALAVAVEVTALWRKLTATSVDAYQLHLAAALHNLANRQTALGRRDEALMAADEAGALYRKLALLQPKAIPDLAKSLSGLAARLYDLDRREEALASAEESVALFRMLAVERPDAFRPDLGKTLTTLAFCLSELGSLVPAVIAAEEAVAIFRELAFALPEAFRPDLARSLVNLTKSLMALGRQEPALQAAEESAALYRELAAAWPDAFRLELAKSLDNLAGVLGDIGRHKPALALAKEALAIFRMLAAEQRDAILPTLATSLTNLAISLRDLGRPTPAQKAAEEAVAIRSELAAARPDAFRPELAVSLAVMADCLEALNQKANALAANASAIETLGEPFLALPQAFAQWMLTMVQQYVTRAQTQGVEPDERLLAPIIPVLMRLMGEQNGCTDGSDGA